MKKFRIQKPRHLWAMVLFVISLVCIAVGGNQHAMNLAQETFLASLIYAHIGASIVLSVGTGLFTGLVIWLFAIYLPERNRRKILRTHMTAYYQNFRRRVIRTLRRPIQDVAPDEEELDNYKKFRAFFGANESKYWLTAISFLRSNQYYIHEILHEMEVFCREAEHVRNNFDIQDPEVHIFLGNIVNVMLQYKSRQIDYDSDDLKPFMRLLWSIFTQWDHLSGQHKEDPIQLMIDKI